MVGYQYKGPLFYLCSILEKKFGACERTGCCRQTVYVYEDNYEIQGFIGMNGEYIEGILFLRQCSRRALAKFC